MELFGNKALFCFTVTRLILTGLFAAASAMLLIGGVRYIKGKRCRGIIAIDGILYAAITIAEVILYICGMTFRTEYGVFGILFENLNILYIIIGLFSAVFSLLRIKGYAIPIIGYTAMGIHCLILFSRMCDALYQDLVSFGVNENTFVNVLCEIFPLLISVGVILIIPYVLYIPADKKRPVYSYPAYTPPVTNSVPMYAPQMRPAVQAQPQYRPGYRPFVPPVQTHTRPSVFNEVFLRNQAVITDFLETKGYTVKSDEESLTVAKTGSDGQSNVNTFVAKADGIYNFIEVVMGGYDLRKRLNCPNPQTARMILLSKYVMEVVKCESGIVNLPEFKALLDVFSVYENVINQHYSRTPNYRSTYILEDYFDLIDIRKKVSFLQ